jgi:uncharacterized protein
MVGTMIVLWIALRSWKIIASVFFSLAVGLALTAALGLAMVGAFNLISIAFFVLFVGLGVDFGIQFSVRYRSERHEQNDLRAALRNAAQKMASPLALAASATAVGFYSFIPTNYTGLSELGLIAGCGMIVAFFCSIRWYQQCWRFWILPESRAQSASSSLPLWMIFCSDTASLSSPGRLARRWPVPPLLFHLHFDFNAIDLQNPNAPSVVAYRGLKQDPETSGNDAEILAPTLGQANEIAKHLAVVPEVSSTRTLSSFIPADQPEKLAAIAAASKVLNSALNPGQRPSPASDQDTINAIRTTAAYLLKVTGNASGPGADLARHVSEC